MLNRLVLRVGCSVLSLLRLERFLEARLRMLDAAIVLNLHQISPRANPFWPGLHPAQFEALVAFAVRRFEVVTIGELAERSAGRGLRRRPLLVFSFDDGYHDFLEYAAPILARHGLRANQNVITSCVESGVPPWNVRMYDFLVAAPPALMRELRIPGFDRVFPASASSSPHERTAYGVALSAHLKKRARAERIELFEPLRQAMEKTDFPSTRMMNLAEVKSVAGTHEIGSHSHAHESMGHESDAFFHGDFDATAEYFAQKLQLPLSVYAFPNGSYRPEQVRYLLDRGVKQVLLVDEQLRRTGATRVIPRVTFHSDSAAESRLRALGWNPRGLAPMQTATGSV